MELGALSLGMQKSREAMRIRFPERDFDERLLSRILKKGFEMRFGSDPDAISRLMGLGNQYRKDGGIFEFRIGFDMRLEVVVAKKAMLPYIQEFGDFLINDGTHGCDVYGMILMVNTLLDSLGKSVMAGYSHFRSEQADHIISSLNILGLNSAGTMMTDEGLEYPLVAEKLQKRHILCVQHYQQQIFSACKGQAGARAVGTQRTVDRWKPGLAGSIPMAGMEEPFAMITVSPNFRCAGVTSWLIDMVAPESMTHWSEVQTMSLIGQTSLRRSARSISKAK
jgi:hypothetical protein